MESCKSKLCLVFVSFIDRILNLIISPFRLDKLLAISGTSLVVSPTLFDFTGTVQFQNSVISGKFSFTNEIDIISYILGGVLIFLSVYLYSKRELNDGTSTNFLSLMDAVEAKKKANSDDNNALIQYWFYKVYGAHIGVGEICFLLNLNDPHWEINDYLRSKNLLNFNNKFELKDGVDLEKSKKKGIFWYIFLAVAALAFYIIFIVLISSGSTIEAMVSLLCTGLIGYGSFLSLSGHGAAFAAERLIKRT
ncbi:hypothetical protein ACTQ72_004529 [Vibrio alginolyticus]